MERDDKNREDRQGISWIQRVAEQSWEPELLISGLAIYATIQLPDYLGKGFQYFQYNLQSGTGFVDEFLPITIFSAFMAAITFLNYAFILHFVVRAFWVGVIGLNSVFRKGIQYDKLEYSELYKEEMKKRIGNSREFLLAVDRVASTIFSIAFAIVLMLIGIGLVYSVFFVLMNVVKAFVSDEVFELYSNVLYTLFIVFFISLAAATIILNLKRFRENERIARFHFKLTWYSSQILFPFIFKPLQYLLLSFMSNIPLKKYYAYTALSMAAFMVFMFANTLGAVESNLFESRDYYATSSDEARYDVNEYESTFKGSYFLKPAVSQPVIERGSLISLFIPYSKLLDTKLEPFCEFEQPADSLAGFIKRRMINRERIGCVNRLFGIHIDSTYSLEPDLMFTRHPATGQAGFRGWYELPDSLKKGRHEFQIRREVVDKADARRDSLGRALSFESRIPFWLQD